MCAPRSAPVARSPTASLASLGVEEYLAIGDETPTLNRRLTSPGDVLVAGLIDSGGLSLAINAPAGTISVDDGVTVSSRTVATGADPEVAASAGPSGDIALTAQSIDLGQESKLLAYATGLYRTGTISLLASKLQQIEFFGNGVVGFTSPFEEGAGISIGQDAV